jgi:MFS family permease
MPLPNPAAATFNDSPPQVERLSDLTGKQWKSGIAAWLGWLFDGMEIHLYALVAAPFVAHLMSMPQSAPDVKEKMAWIQAAFLVGWAVGGGVFGRVGDVLGRSRTLALTILTYAIFTSLAFFAATWWQLMIFRFMAALGIGGEWAVGASLLAETWPKKWHAWVAAVLQTAVNIGILLACLWVYLLAGAAEKYVFLIGVIPAGIVYWIRLSVGEPEAWHAAKEAGTKPPPFSDLFAGGLLRTTLMATVVCACALTAWWAFLFWYVQHLRNLLGEAGRSSADTQRLVSAAFFLVIGVSIGGNFFAAGVAKLMGYRNAIALMLFGFFAAIFGTYCVPRDYRSIFFWIPWIGWFSGVFGLFTMYLPSLFPVLLRTTGAGFCFNIGRLAAAFGTVLFVRFSGDLRAALFKDAFLLLPAAFLALMMPDNRDSG